MAEESNLQFGMEMELVLAHCIVDQLNGTTKYASDQEIRTLLLEQFQAAYLLAYESPFSSRHDHRYWGITYDASIGYMPDGSGEGIEIKTPIMVDGSFDYENTFETVWNIIQPLMVSYIEQWKNCSTHIHFSYKNHEEFPLRRAQLLVFSAIYFEAAIDDLNPGMPHLSDRKRPGGWKSCSWARSNTVREAGGSPKLDLRSIWRAIRKTKTLKELHLLVCWDDDTHRREMNLHMKYFKWNLKGLDYKTIEFRQMSPSRSAHECLNWINFTRGFVTRTACLDSAQLKRAEKGEIAFAEAMGMGLGESRREDVMRQEDTWGAGDTGQSVWHLRVFMGDIKPGFWEGMMSMRDQLYSELENLNYGP
ncbi:hypothetical protein F5Y19DRAFT_482722 [Xylariaceae sp. FL1651]|nr:hypothetical protein F5Y19DRAFT_482722 [Xylariaceae sp. FL1651]